MKNRDDPTKDCMAVCLLKKINKEKVSIIEFKSRNIKRIKIYFTGS